MGIDGYILTGPKYGNNPECFEREDIRCHENRAAGLCVFYTEKAAGGAPRAGAANHNLPRRIPLKRKLFAIRLSDLLWPEERGIWLTTINSCENILRLLAFLGMYIHQKLL